MKEGKNIYGIFEIIESNAPGKNFKKMGISKMAKQTNDTPALNRALNIIEYISETNKPVSLKTISTDLNIPMSSAFRLVKNLVSRGYLIEVNHGCLLYSMGTRIALLAYNYNKNISINSVARPIMNILSQQTDQTSQLAVMSNNQFIYIEQVLPPVPVSFIAPLHTPIAVNYSAGAKIILAHKPEKFQREYLASVKLEAKTENTLVTVDAILDDLKVSYERGYALDREEFTLGIGCIAAAVKDFKRECVGAIGITGYIQQYKESALGKLEYEVKIAAREISKAYGDYED